METKSYYSSGRSEDRIRDSLKHFAQKATEEDREKVFTRYSIAGAQGVLSGLDQSQTLGEVALGLLVALKENDHELELHRGGEILADHIVKHIPQATGKERGALHNRVGGLRRAVSELKRINST